MDILTQSLLGGVLAQSVAQKHEKKLATLTGAVAGLLADADFFIQSSTDPLLNIEYHRHFTHSVFFIPIGAAIALLLLWPFMRRHLSIGRLYVFCLAGYSCSGLLDAFTSYGTHLFWPLSDERVALNIISIIDPVFTLVLLSALLIGLRISNKNIAAIGLLFCVAYLGVGFMQLQRARSIAEDLYVVRGHSAEQHVVKPTLGNLILWRSVYIHNNRIYVDAIRVGVFAKNQIFEGESLEKFVLERDLQRVDVNSILYKDIQRFMRFSEGFVALDPAQKNVIGDIRYSMLPVSTKPLWGIVIQPDQPESHVDYRFFRINTSEMRQEFFSMLF